ncbi:hypothetical protein [Bdellovibrio bacteriovorus]|uniref:hypothetical protein n=1 Tax=Bdellovibrio bacteriovorus TaxID=959 RepID=UPI0012FBAC9F|nr:hypothetical protein [Bdellovibrio bacteriovorus]
MTLVTLLAFFSYCISLNPRTPRARIVVQIADWAVPYLGKSIGLDNIWNEDVLRLKVSEYPQEATRLEASSPIFWGENSVLTIDSISTDVEGQTVTLLLEKYEGDKFHIKGPKATTECVVGTLCRSEENKTNLLISRFSAPSGKMMEVALGTTQEFLSDLQKKVRVQSIPGIFGLVEISIVGVAGKQAEQRLRYLADLYIKNLKKVLGDKLLMRVNAMAEIIPGLLFVDTTGEIHTLNAPAIFSADKYNKYLPDATATFQELLVLEEYLVLEQLDSIGSTKEDSSPHNKGNGNKKYERTLGRRLSLLKKLENLPLSTRQQFFQDLQQNLTRNLTLRVSQKINLELENRGKIQDSIVVASQPQIDASTSNLYTISVALFIAVISFLGALTLVLIRDNNFLTRIQNALSTRFHQS